MSLRQELHGLCHNHLAGRIKEIQATIAQVQDAIANETKSSAGDKYETGREMLQQEINLNQTNLNELNKTNAALERIPITQATDTICPGSVIHTDRGNYYLAAGLGAFLYNGQKYYTISPASPIGRAMAGLKKGAVFHFNNADYTIIKVG